MKRLILCLALAGCAAVPQATVPAAPQPTQVTLYRDTVTVSFRDGSLCTAPRTTPSGGWSTTLKGCPHSWPVTATQATRTPRLPLAPAAGPAQVVLQAPAGPLGFADPGTAS